MVYSTKVKQQAYSKKYYKEFINKCIKITKNNELKPFTTLS